MEEKFLVESYLSKKMRHFFIGVIIKKDASADI